MESRSGKRNFLIVFLTLAICFAVGAANYFLSPELAITSNDEQRTILPQAVLSEREPAQEIKHDVTIDQPAITTKPVQSAETIEITKPVDNEKPAEIKRSAEISRPSEVMKPVEPTKPAYVAKAMEPTKSADVTKPVGPTRAAEVLESPNGVRPLIASSQSKPISTEHKTQTTKVSEIKSPAAVASVEENKSLNEPPTVDVPKENTVQPVAISKQPALAAPAPVEEKKAIPPETSPPASPRPDPEFWVWGGVGENYQYYQQNIPSLSGSAKFQNIQGPTLYLSAGTQAENFGFEFVHKETPGEMEAPSGAIARNGKFTWKTLSTEFLYKPDDAIWRLRGGFQYHAMPFMSYTPSTRELDIKTNSLIMATVGFDRYFRVSKKLRGEWQMRYQHPLASGTKNSDTFKVSPEFAFDGSLGSVYSVNENFRMGLFWYGQYHNYKFEYSGATSFAGKQTLFYSNVELRLGLEF